jgi:hypothetical protein
MPRWIAVLFAAPLLLAQDDLRRSSEPEVPGSRLVIPEKLPFSIDDLKGKARLLADPGQFNTTLQFRKERDLAPGKSARSAVKVFVLPGRSAGRTTDCSIPLLRMPAGPESAGPIRRIPVDPADPIPNRMPAPPCEGGFAIRR